MALTVKQINDYLNSNDRLLFPAVDYANDIIGLPITDDVFGGVQAVYDKLTNYARKIVRVQADNRMSEIKSMATLLATQLDPTVTTDWVAGIWVEAGSVLNYNGMRYIVNDGKSHKTKVGWEPDKAPSLFRKAPIDENTGYPIWVQPTGAHDAYQTGDRVVYNGTVYESTVDANIYAPGVVAGQWVEVV